MWLTVKWVAVGRYTVVGKFSTRLCALRSAGRELGVVPHHGDVVSEAVAVKSTPEQSHLFVPWPAVPDTAKEVAFSTGVKVK